LAQVKKTPVRAFTRYSDEIVVERLNNIEKNKNAISSLHGPIHIPR